MRFMNKDSEEDSEMRCTKLSLIAIHCICLISGFSLLIFVILLETDTIGLAIPLPVTMSLVIAVSALLVFPAIGLFTTLNLNWSFVLWCYTFFTLLTVTLYGLTSVYSLIYLTGLDTDSALKKGWDGLFQSLENMLIRYTVMSPGDGLKLQTFFGCCGISFKAVYSYERFKMSLEDFIRIQATGPACGNVTELLDIYNMLPMYSESAESKADTILGSPFFCNDVVHALLLENIILVSVLVVISLVIAFSSVCCSCLLLCSQEEEDSIGTVFKRNAAKGTRRNRGIESAVGALVTSSLYDKPVLEEDDRDAFPKYRPPPPPPPKAPNRMQLLVKPKEYHAEAGFESGPLDYDEEKEDYSYTEEFRPMPEESRGGLKKAVNRSNSIKGLDNSRQSPNQFVSEYQYDSDDTDSFFNDGETIVSR